eukprot:TRINITY_DN11012_c0_g1_i1.p1 TRINITY_DN11012_c0_g1~~TRINITY_DN11012_c0_g1_i1.p1  ORF type:complete len:803 (+),score=117.06 TRINITY_DN11012_c0_g1_i1:38-2410(+)
MRAASAARQNVLLVDGEDRSRAAGLLAERVARLVLRVEWGSRERAVDLAEVDSRRPRLAVSPDARPASAPPAFLPAAVPHSAVCGTAAVDSSGALVHREALLRPRHAATLPGDAPQTGKLCTELNTPLANARFLVQAPCRTLERAAKAQQLVHALRAWDSADVQTTPVTSWSRYRFAPGWAETAAISIPKDGEEQAHRRLAAWTRRDLLWEALSGAGDVQAAEQAARRELQVHRKAGEQHAASVSIQKMVRGNCSRRRVLQRCAAIVLIQCAIRCALARTQLQHRRTARLVLRRTAAGAALLQRTSRGFAARATAGKAHARRAVQRRWAAAAGMAQRCGRGMIARSTAGRQHRHQRAACCIQRCCRCFLSRASVRSRRAARAVREDAACRYALLTTDVRRVEVTERAGISEDWRCRKEHLRRLQNWLAQLCLRRQLLEQLPAAPARPALAAAGMLCCQEQLSRARLSVEEWEASGWVLAMRMYECRWADRMLPSEGNRRVLLADVAALCSSTETAADDTLPSASPVASPAVAAAVESASAPASSPAPMQSTPSSGPGVRESDAVSLGLQHEALVRGAEKAELSAVAAIAADTAAISIQCALRSMLARRRVSRACAEHSGREALRAHAAVVVQCVWRGAAARAGVKLRKPQLMERRRKRRWRQEMQRQYRSAVCIQRWWRAEVLRISEGPQGAALLSARLRAVDFREQVCEEQRRRHELRAKEESDRLQLQQLRLRMDAFNDARRRSLAAEPQRPLPQIDVFESTARVGLVNQEWWTRDRLCCTVRYLLLR